jgi:hypothetical protein
MTHCPVCELPVDAQATACPQCGWEFPYFLGLTEADVARYREALAQAQAAWQQPAADAATEAIASTETTAAAVESATTPQLGLQADESIADFNARLHEQGPYSAGTAMLLTDHYDNKRHSLPLLVSWAEWLPLALTGLYVQVDAETCQQLAAHSQLKVMAHLSADPSGSIVVRGLSLETETETLGIKQFEDEQYWAWLQTQDNLAAYQQYLASHVLKNHHQAAREQVQRLTRQQQQQETLILISGFVLAGLGTALGAGLMLQWFESFMVVMTGGLGGALLLCGSGFLVYTIVTTLSVCPKTTLFAIDSINGQRVPQRYLHLKRQQTPTFTVRGWAIDKPAGQPAGGVLLKLGRQSISALYGRERQDVVRNLAQEAYRYTGFTVTCDSALLPVGEYELPLRILTHDKRRYFLPEKTIRLMVE